MLPNGSANLSTSGPRGQILLLTTSLLEIGQPGRGSGERLPLFARAPEHADGRPVPMLPAPCPQRMPYGTARYRNVWRASDTTCEPMQCRPLRPLVEDASRRWAPDTESGHRSGLVPWHWPSGRTRKGRPAGPPQQGVSGVSGPSVGWPAVPPYPVAGRTNDVQGLLGSAWALAMGASAPPGVRPIGFVAARGPHQETIGPKKCSTYAQANS